MTTATVPLSLIYHAMTSYPQADPGAWEDRLPGPRAGFVSGLPGEVLPEVKQYEACVPRLSLPAHVPGQGISGARALSGQQGGPPGRLSLTALARLLFYSAGVVRFWDSAVRGRVHFRAAGSAGALYPLELYVVTGDLPGLRAGVWHFDPIAHSLRRVGDAERDAGPCLVVTGVPARTGWKYAERGYRHLWWDCGTLLAHVVLLARTAGLPARIRLAFPDDDIGRLVGADGVHELPLAIVPLTAGEPRLTSRGTAAAGQLGAHSVEYPLVTATHRAGWRVNDEWRRVPVHRQASAREDGQDLDDGGEPDDGREPLERLILRRGSTRRFDPGGAVPATALAWCLAAASCSPPWDAGASLLEHHVVAHRIPGLPGPGLYRWRAGNLAAAARHPADCRSAARKLCAGMRQAHDAACVVVHCAELGSVIDRLGERGYRAALLAAGYAHGRLLLASFALGYGGSALTITEGEAEGVLDDPVTPLLATCVGIPSYRSRPGGLPLSPTRITRAW